jgi:PKD repeat protein
MAWWVRAVPIPGDPNALPIWRMQGAPYDVVAPTVNVSVPTTARVGQDVIMRATARDRWTGATVTWDFGDGGTEEGETLMYAYAEPGSYVVRITATDGAGNTRSATRQITVTSGGTRP